MKLLVIGASSEPTCGVRACAAVLAPALEAAGVQPEQVWWEQEDERTPERWLAALRAARPDAVLWHYAPTRYGRHGVPTLVPRVLRALRASRAPIVPFLHELAHDLTTRDWRGLVQGSAQRAALVPLLRSAAGALVTTEPRLEWLRTRLWLPRRPLAFTPVPSNVPVAAAPVPGNGALRVGVFGFRSGAGLQPRVVTDGVAAVPGARLSLVGAPGADAPEAQAWRDAAAASGCTLAFSGVLEPPQLSAALAALDVVVLADRAGPSPRKGTLAAALAHGVPVVAVGDRATWRPLVDEGGVVVAPPERLTETLAELAGSPEARLRLGDRGRAFYERRLSASVVAGTVADFLAEVTR